MENELSHKSTSHVDLPSLLNWGDNEWRKDAYCKGMGPDAFFPQMGETDNIPLVSAKVRLICAGCKVRKECLSFALENHLKYGVYGGVGPQDRRKMTLETVTGLLPLSVVMRDLRKVRTYTKETSTKTFIPQLAKVLHIAVDEARDLVRDPVGKFV